MRPRTPISPPLMPTNTLPLTTKGAAVVVSPRLMSPVLRRPLLLAGLGVERDDVIVERDQEDLAVVVGDAARDHVAAGDALRRGVWFGNVGPFQIAGRRSRARTPCWERS